MKSWKKMLVYLLTAALLITAATPVLATDDVKDTTKEETEAAEEENEAAEEEEDKAEDETEAAEDAEAEAEDAEAEEAEEAEAAEDEEDVLLIAEEAVTLDLWEDDSEARRMLEDYIAAVTDEEGEEYIPEADRIAVFDLDGTLFCETDPIYLEWLMYVKRAMFDVDSDPTEDDIQLCRDIAKGILTGELSDDLEMRQIEAETRVFAGMTYEEYVQYVKDLADLPCYGYDNMKVGEAFYRPMVQVVDYLKDNGFKVYVVSGSGRTFIRVLSEEVLGIPKSQFIGTDTWVIASGMEDADGGEYVFQKDDELVLSDELVLKNIKMNKILQMVETIGQKPVLSFGNSSGDLSMAEYVCWDNEYDAMAFMLCCDDTERENGKPEKAAKMEGTCIEYGFVPVSMKNDWKTIYGDQVTRKEIAEIDEELDEEEQIDKMLSRLDVFFNPDSYVKPQQYAAKIVNAYENGLLTEDEVKEAIELLTAAISPEDEAEDEAEAEDDAEEKEDEAEDEEDASEEDDEEAEEEDGED